MMKITKWLAAGVMLGMAGAASATEVFGVMPGAELSPMTTTAAGPAPKLYIVGTENPCPASHGLDLGDVNSALTKASLDIILTARAINADVAFGYDDETCLVHTLQMVPPTPTP